MLEIKEQKLLIKMKREFVKFKGDEKNFLYYPFMIDDLCSFNIFGKSKKSNKDRIGNALKNLRDHDLIKINIGAASFLREMNDGWNNRDRISEMSIRKIARKNNKIFDSRTKFIHLTRMGSFMADLLDTDIK